MLRIGPHVIEFPYLLAPMAGVSEMPFRVLAFELGAGLATTELISAKGIFYQNRRTRQYMTFDRVKERPYSLQLFGGDEESMAVAAREAMEHGAEIIDINMGCPVKKVTKTGAGSSLLCDPERAANLVKKMRVAVEDRVPITAKIRSGWDANHINCVEMGRALEDAGCAAVAMHARTRAQAYSGVANWHLIGELKAALQIPVIGNGDVVTVADAQRMFRETDCDAVMIGRGALGNPWIFQALREGREVNVPAAERKTFILRHLREHVSFHLSLDDEETRAKRRNTAEQQAIRTFRQHLIWYSRGLRGGSTFRQQAMTLETFPQVEDAIERFFCTMAADPSSLEADGDTHADDDGINYQQAFG